MHAAVLGRGERADGQRGMLAHLASSSQCNVRWLLSELRVGCHASFRGRGGHGRWVQGEYLELRGRMVGV